MRLSLVLAVVLVPGVVFACDVDVRPPRPPVVQINVQQLSNEAAQLEAQAATKESTARALDNEAQDDEQRAIAMRVMAASRGEAEREMLLARADGLAAQAMVLRSQASQRRDEASALRARAQSLRAQAAIKPVWRARGI